MYTLIPLLAKSNLRFISNLQLIISIVLIQIQAQVLFINSSTPLALILLRYFYLFTTNHLFLRFKR